MRIVMCLFLVIVTLTVTATLSGCMHQAEPEFDPFHFSKYLGAYIRGDSTKPFLSMVFTGDEFADGADVILDHLGKHTIKASFFLTGKFYDNPDFEPYIRRMVNENHYLGAHSDRHLLYCNWENRNRLLIDKTTFINDLNNNYSKMKKYGLSYESSRFFLPPYEWYNQEISDWTKQMELKLINFTPGTMSHADYTIPDTITPYYSSSTIMNSIIQYEKMSFSGLNGFILLMHIGTHPKRTDKFYTHLEELIVFLEDRKYTCISIDRLLCE